MAANSSFGVAVTMARVAALAALALAMAPVAMAAPVAMKAAAEKRVPLAEAVRVGVWACGRV